MGYSQLKIPKICGQCWKPFEAKTVITRYCSTSCNNKSIKEKKKQAKDAERKQVIQKQSANQIAAIQTRPYISITEATILFDISKNTIHRLIKAGKVPAMNLGQRLTGVSRTHIEAQFTAVEIPKEPKEQPMKLHYEKDECYTINEIFQKYGVSLSTVDNVIRWNSLPKRQIGNYVYVPKELINKKCRQMKQLSKTKVTVRLRKADDRKEWYVYIESYPVNVPGKQTPQRIRGYLNRSVSTVEWDKKRTVRTYVDGVKTYKPKRNDNGIIVCRNGND